MKIPQRGRWEFTLCHSALVREVVSVGREEPWMSHWESLFTTAFTTSRKILGESHLTSWSLLPCKSQLEIWKKILGKMKTCRYESYST